jgi:hypothetical protein
MVAEVRHPAEVGDQAVPALLILGLHHEGEQFVGDGLLGLLLVERVEHDEAEQLSCPPRYPCVDRSPQDLVHDNRGRGLAGRRQELVRIEEFQGKIDVGISGRLVTLGNVLSSIAATPTEMCR